MARVDKPLIPLLGFYPSGDLGNLTIYTSKRRKPVWFEKAPPKQPPSILQRGVRARFSQAAWLWSTLPEATRLDWQRAATKAGLRITGFNLFVHWVMTGNTPTVTTVERHSKIQLL